MRVVVEVRDTVDTEGAEGAGDAGGADEAGEATEVLAQRSEVSQPLDAGVLHSGDDMSSGVVALLAPTPLELGKPRPSNHMGMSGDHRLVSGNHRLVSSGEYAVWELAACNFSAGERIGKTGDVLGLSGWLWFGDEVFWELPVECIHPRCREIEVEVEASHC